MADTLVLNQETNSKYISSAGISAALCFILYTFQRFLPLAGTLISLSAPVPLILGALYYGKRWLFETSFTSFVLVFIFNDLTGSLMFLFYFLGAVFAVYYHVFERKKLSLILPVLAVYNLVGEYISLLMLTGAEGQLFGFFEKYWYVFAILMSVMTFILYERVCLIIMHYIKNRGIYVKKRRIA